IAITIVAITFVTISIVAVTLIRIAAPVVLRATLRRRLGLRRDRGRTVDDLVELAAIEPHAAALRAIVDLDALPVRHQQLRLVYRALHPLLLVREPRC